MRIMRDRLNSKCGNSCKPCQELIQFKVMLLECKVCAYVRVCTHVYVCTHVFVCMCVCMHYQSKHGQCLKHFVKFYIQLLKIPNTHTHLRANIIIKIKGNEVDFLISSS